jgi:hypothetical protein
MAASTLRDAQAEEKELKRLRQKPSFLQKVRQATAKPVKDLADIAAEHPVKAALPMIPIGASLGATAVRAFKR